MGLRGPKPRSLVSTKWSSSLAYVVGLITTDGSLSLDGRHIDFTSKDLQLAELYKKCLGIEHIKIGYKTNGSSGARCARVQFGDVHFYQWLEKVGLTTKKSLTIKSVKIPQTLFLDFVRGCFDGDGTIYSFWDTRWANSFMFYIAFASGSKRFLFWMQKKLYLQTGIKGHISEGKRAFQLRYAKNESMRLFQQMFYAKDLPCLKRKFDKAQSIFAQQDKISMRNQYARVVKPGKHASLRG